MATRTYEEETTGERLSPKRSDEAQANASGPTWRDALAEQCESTAVHISLMVLLLIDIICICMEFLVFYTGCGDGSGLEDTQADGLSEVQSDANHVLHAISITILIIFAIHLLLLMVALGGAFCHHKGYILDVVVISVALVVELSGVATLHGDLVTLLLLTRVVRIVHALQLQMHLQKKQQGVAVSNSQKDFEIEMGDVMFEKDSVRQTASKTASNVALIMANDEDFIATLEVPEDIASINDAQQLRRLLTCERQLRQRIIG